MVMMVVFWVVAMGIFWWLWVYFDGLGSGRRLNLVVVGKELVVVWVILGCG